MSESKEYEKFLKKIAKNIKDYRILNGYTQEEMTNFGFNYRHYQKLESGTHSPSLSTIHRLAKVFKIDVTDLFS